MWIVFDPFSIEGNVPRIGVGDSSLVGVCPESEFPAELRSAAVISSIFPHWLRNLLLGDDGIYTLCLVGLGVKWFNTWSFWLEQTSAWLRNLLLGDVGIYTLCLVGLGVKWFSTCSGGGSKHCPARSGLRRVRNYST